MVKFKVIERLMKIGPLKGKKGYGAAPKAQEKFSQSWLIQRIVRETSLKRGRCAQRAYNAAQHYYRGGYAGRCARPWRHLLAARLYALDVYRERGRRYFKSIEEAGHYRNVERQHPASTERHRG